MDLAVAYVRHPVTGLGPGRRVGIWVQGCSIGCRGCMSRDTWEPGGTRLDVDALAHHVAEIIDANGADGVTVSGGEPFQQPGALRRLVTELRRLSPSVDVLVYSGHSFPWIQRHHADWIGLIDAVIAGPFVESQPSDHPWMGSANQELVITSDRCSSRYRCEPRPGVLQVAVEDGEVRLAGVPRIGDLDAFRAALADRGVILGSVSWAR